MGLCKYKNMFGELRTGIHTMRDPIFNTALIDVGITVVGAFVISNVIQYNFWYVLIILFIIGIISHRAFCVRTTVDKFLFPDYE